MELKYLQSKFTFDELFSYKGLQKLDDDFIRFLGLKYPQMKNKIIKYRNNKLDENTSLFLMDLAKTLEKYLAYIFDIEDLVSIRREKIIDRKSVV